MTADRMTEFDTKLATLLIGVDSLFGGDALASSGKDRVIVDTWTSGLDAPAIYYDPIASQLRKMNGYKKTGNFLVRQFIDRHDLENLPQVIREEAKSLDADRCSYMVNLATCLEEMLQTAIELRFGKGLSSPKKRIETFERCYRAATNYEGDIGLIDTTKNDFLINPSI